MTDQVAVPVNPPKSHFVYLIEDEQSRTKIGHSSDPQRRVSAMLTGSPELMHVAHSWACTRPTALALEAALHSLFKWARIRGEWFEIDVEDAIPIGDAVLAGKLKLAQRGADLIRQIYDAHEEDDSETVEDHVLTMAGLGMPLELWANYAESI